MTKNVLISLLEAKKFKAIHDVLSEYNPVDIAELLSELDQETLVLVFRMIEKEKAAQVFSYMDSDLSQVLIEAFSKQEIEELFDKLFADDAVDFLEDMPANVVSKLLENVDKTTRAKLNRLLNYPEDSAGSIMTVEFVEIKLAATVSDALAKVRLIGGSCETVYVCYVVDRHKLVGTISARDLLINDSQTPIKDLMEDHFIFVSTHDDKENVANLFRKYDLLAIPVLDSEGYIVGIVTVDDAMDVLIDEATEDMQIMAAMEASDEPYLKTSVWQHAKHRIVWLLVLMLSATITGRIISNYESAFNLLPILVSFIPMLMDTGGNCGSQSSTLVIRGLAVHELHFSDTLQIIWKEFRVSLVVSAALALANGLRIFLIYQDIRLALVVSLSLICTIVGSKVVGCLLPIFAKKCRLDPAIMAAPLITTIVDAFSIIIYFQIATAVFHI